MQESLLSIFFEVSQQLLTPIIVGMTVVGAWLLFLIGATAREGLERLLLGRLWRRYIDNVRMRAASPDDWEAAARYTLHRWVAARSKSLYDLAIMVREAEVIAHKRLSRLQILVRIGPMIGLVGTLIPLGPALQGLSKSDLDELGTHMNIAFTMTVFGILIGAMAYALYVVHRSWSEQDLSDLELIHSISELEKQSKLEIADESKDQALAS
jgi:biopolymer transport protein ExbB/TolQ